MSGSLHQWDALQKSFMEYGRRDPKWDKEWLMAISRNPRVTWGKLNKWKDRWEEKKDKRREGSCVHSKPTTVQRLQVTWIGTAVPNYDQQHNPPVVLAFWLATLNLVCPTSHEALRVSSPDGESELSPRRRCFPRVRRPHHLIPPSELPLRGKKHPSHSLQAANKSARENTSAGTKELQCPTRKCLLAANRRRDKQCRWLMGSSCRSKQSCAGYLQQLRCVTCPFKPVFSNISWYLLPISFTWEFEY